MAPTKLQATVWAGSRLVRSLGLPKQVRNRTFNYTSYFPVTGLSHRITIFRQHRTTQPFPSRFPHPLWGYALRLSPFFPWMLCEPLHRWSDSHLIQAASDSPVKTPCLSAHLPGMTSDNPGRWLPRDTLLQCQGGSVFLNPSSRHTSPKGFYKQDHNLQEGRLWPVPLRPGFLSRV